MPVAVSSTGDASMASRMRDALASDLVKGGTARHVLVVGVEKASVAGDSRGSAGPPCGWGYSAVAGSRPFPAVFRGRG